MAHYAKIDNNNTVEQVIVVENRDTEKEEIEFIKGILGGNWVKTSYNTRAGVHLLGGTPLRKNYAATGFIYDPVADAFYPPKPPQNPSWVIDPETGLWVPPLPKPTEEGFWFWDEDTLSWVLDVEYGASCPV